MPPEASSEERAAEGAVEGVPAAQPTEEVRTETREPERPASTVVAASGGIQSSSSLPSFPDFRAWAVERGKAPMASGDDIRSVGRAASSDVQLFEGASALANHDLAKRLCQATILPADHEIMKNQQVSDMFSSFYPTMIRVSLSPSLFIFVVAFYQFDLLTVGSLFVANLQYVRAGGRISEVRRSAGGLEG